MSKNTGGPAFPIVDDLDVVSAGLTIRDYFAARAMTAALSAGQNRTYGPLHADNNLAIAICSYAIADAMLAAREK